MNTSVAVATQQYDIAPASVKQTLENKRIVQQVMESVMKQNVHYGIIPGCKQPSLYKAGSEALLSTFHISAEPQVEELITRDAKGRMSEVRYRVKCIGKHTPSGQVVGFGIGECSTGEDKYAWRRAVCLEEFDTADETLRRVKWSKYQGKTQKTEQVSVSPSDMLNTVLKMAKKRAQIDMTLTTLGCSDIFSQDLEDLDEALRENIAANERTEPAVTELAIKWTADANAATTQEQLTKVWEIGIKAIKDAQDMAGYNLFKAAVTARGEALKAAQPVSKAEPASDAMAGLVADMESAADGGLEAFESAWGSLSKATKGNLAGHYDALIARASRVPA